MASTYSPTLRFEIIGNGEQANTWGTTTNTNIGTLIEQSIAGLVSVDVTAGNVTLTSLNGASDEARQMIINVTGSPGTARTVFAPAVSKVYVVINSSDDDVDIQTTTLGIAYTVASGVAAFVYCDGTDFGSATGDALPITGGTITGNLNVLGTLTRNGYTVLNSNNFNTYAPTNTGTGASGTWGISITGNAATATSATTAVSATTAGSATTATTATTANAVNTSNNYQMNSLGVGTAGSGTPGEIRATNNVTAYYTSDSRLKKDQKKLTNPLKKVNALNGVEFDWDDEYIKRRGGEDGFFVRKHDVGVIAQQVQKVLPEAVAQKPDGFLGVQYEKLIPLLLEAIKELSDKVEALENR
jgi:hypothetical protein